MHHKQPIELEIFSDIDPELSTSPRNKFADLSEELLLSMYINKSSSANTNICSSITHSLSNIFSCCYSNNYREKFCCILKYYYDKQYIKLMQTISHQLIALPSNMGSQLKLIFDNFDKNSDGSLTKQDICSVMNSLDFQKITAFDKHRTSVSHHTLNAENSLSINENMEDIKWDGAEIADIFNVFFELQNENEMNFTEFLMILSAEIPFIFDNINDEEIEKCFGLCDADKDYYISKNDLRILFETQSNIVLNDSQLDSIMGRVSSDGQFISFEDFAKLMKSEVNNDVNDDEVKDENISGGNISNSDDIFQILIAADYIVEDFTAHVNDFSYKTIIVEEEANLS